MYIVYGKQGCYYCTLAEQLLGQFNKEFQYIDIEEDMDALDLIVSNGFKTVPQIYLDGEHIGGYEDLKKQLVTI